MADVQQCDPLQKEHPDHHGGLAYENPFGYDNTFDLNVLLYATSNMRLFGEAEIIPEQDEDQTSFQEIGRRLFFCLAFPDVSRRPITFAYQRALANRIRSPYLEPGEKYDINAYTPTFIHDTLMLPGSLANLLNKVKDAKSMKQVTAG